MPLSVAVLGHGHLGKWHCEKVAQAGANLNFIVETRQEEHASIRAKFPHCQVLTELKQLAGKVDAAIVSTPTFAHFGMVKELLNLSIHVFCEKPLCQTSAEALELESLAREKKLVLQVGHSERFHQCFEDLTAYRDFIGPNTLVQIRRGAPYKGRATDVDVVADLMIHDVDLMLKLMGQAPQSVRAKGLKVLSSHYDYVSSEFSFPSGGQCSIVSSRVDTQEARSIQICGPGGTLFFDLLSAQVQIGRWQEQSKGWQLNKHSYPKRDHLLLEQQGFYRAIEHNLPPLVSAGEAQQVIVLLEKVWAALQQGSEVMCL